MLILSRRVGETLTVGAEVTMTILSTKGNRVQIGINAPTEVTIHREEIYNRIAQQQNEPEATAEPKEISYKCKASK